jgi:prepilin peptidase CpaA
MHEVSSMFELLVMLLTDPRTCVLFALLTIAAVIDYRTYRIPNWLTMGGAGFALLYVAVIPFSVQHGLLWALGGFTLGLFIMLPLFALRVMGAGDVKLMAMVGAFLGLSDTFHAVLATFIVGGVAALAFAIYHGVLGRLLGNLRSTTGLMLMSALAGMRPQVPADESKSIGKLPYGVSIAIGTIGYVAGKQLGFV